MGKATIADAFNASINFGRQVLDYKTEKSREQTILELNNENDIINTNIQNYIRDHQYVGGAAEDDDRKAYDEYLSGLNYFIDEQIHNSKQKNHSQFYWDSMDQSAVQLRENARNYALGRQDEWNMNREDVSRGEDIQRYMAADMDPQRKLNAIYNRIRLSKTRRPINPQQENDMRIAAERAVYEQYAVNYLKDFNDVNDLQDAMKHVRDTFAGFMPSSAVNIYDDKGNVIETKEQPWGFENREQWEKDLIDKETARIQGEHFEVIDRAQSTMVRLLVSGRLEEAIALANEWRPKWDLYYNPNNKEFANSNQEYLNRGENFFDVRKLEGYQSQGEVGKWVSLLEAYTLDMFLRPQIIDGGNGTVIVGYNEDGSPITMRYESLDDAYDGFLHYKREAFFRDKRKDNIEDYVTLQLWQAELNDWNRNFYTKVGQALNQIDPNLSYDYDRFRQYETFLNPESDYYNRDIRNFSDHQKELYAQNCVRLFHSIFFNGIKDSPSIRQMMRDFVGSDITRLLNWGSTPDNDGDYLLQLKAFSDKAKSGEAENIIFKLYSPERLNLSGQASVPTYHFRSTNLERAVNNFVEEERRRIAGILGLGTESLKTSWMPSDRISGDVIPKGMFVIQSGQHAGTYYLDYDDNANPIVMKRNNSGGWGEYRRGTRQPTVAESTTEFMRENTEFNRNLSNNRHPILGNEFIASTLPPPNSSVPMSSWNDPRNTTTMRNQAWASYFIELQNNPSMIGQIVRQGKNPFTGEVLDLYNNVPPGINARSWQNNTTYNNERRMQAWIDNFTRQLSR